MSPLQDGVGLDFGRPQRSRGVGREIRIAHPRGEDHDAALFKMANGATPDIGLTDLGHVNRGQDPRRAIHALESVLQRERIDHRAQHAHDVRSRAIHPLARPGRASPDVASTDDDRDLHVQLIACGADLLRKSSHCGGVDRLLGRRARKRLAGELEHDPAPTRAGRSSRLGDTSLTVGVSAGSRADDGLSETDQLCVTEYLPDGLFLVPDIRLNEEHPLLVPPL